MAWDFMHLSNQWYSCLYFINIIFSPSRSGRNLKELKRSIGGWKVDKTFVQCQKISEIKKWIHSQRLLLAREANGWQRTWQNSKRAQACNAAGREVKNHINCSLNPFPCEWTDVSPCAQFPSMEDTCSRRFHTQSSSHQPSLLHTFLRGQLSLLCTLS